MFLTRHSIGQFWFYCRRPYRSEIFTYQWTGALLVHVQAGRQPAPLSTCLPWMDVDTEIKIIGQEGCTYHTIRIYALPIIVVCTMSVYSECILISTVHNSINIIVVVLCHQKEGNKDKEEGGKDRREGWREGGDRGGERL